MVVLLCKCVRVCMGRQLIESFDVIVTNRKKKIEQLILGNGRKINYLLNALVKRTME